MNVNVELLAPLCRLYRFVDEQWGGDYEVTSGLLCLRDVIHRVSDTPEEYDALYQAVWSALGDERDLAFLGSKKFALGAVGRAVVAALGDRSALRQYLHFAGGDVAVERFLGELQAYLGLQ